MYSLNLNQEVKVETLNEKLKDKKLELEYPCSWCYKVIASEKETLQKAINDVIDKREHTLSPSNQSKNGKYVSMNLELLVHNEEDRQFIYDALKKHQDIKMVL